MPKAIDVGHLFEVTVRVFCERGFDATTTKDIASRAGVNEVTLYRRFGTKAALIGTALGHVLSQSPFSRIEGSDDVRSDLAGIVEAYAATHRAYGDAVVVLLSELPRHPELRSGASALMPNLRRAAGILRGHQERGAIGPGDPLQKLVFLIAPLVADGLWRRSGVASEPPALDALDIADAFLRSHRRQDAASAAPRFHLLVRAIVERDGHFLLTREKGSPFAFLPGGHVEPGEPATRALERELREELGVDARVGGYVGAVEHAWSDAAGNAHQEVNHLFRVSAASLGATPVASREPQLEVFWCAPEAFDAVDLRPEPVRALLVGARWHDDGWWASTHG
jgi:AcrR family transcriptional regulator